MMINTNACRLHSIYTRNRETRQSFGTRIADSNAEKVFFSLLICTSQSFVCSFLLALSFLFDVEYMSRVSFHFILTYSRWICDPFSSANSKEKVLCSIRNFSISLLFCVNSSLAPEKNSIFKRVRDSNHFPTHNFAVISFRSNPNSLSVSKKLT